ncbi:hypothetical protein J7E24_06815 [Hymenobacter sp. ISL-91]|uniref:WapI family immunity protein n=1 Tax=Hymenobacter sp. ISL-91 TaxID=2819151 RepID=UPI001BED3694|nr:hypothetical protein [Hymenobacter sp. ISL-91]MBT2557491.1 hypothetical protein [Hymenobacter sp. ISL-91]
MILSGIYDQTVELKITNYQFPENLDGDWDGNWLNIYLKVDSKIGKWQTVDPSLTTCEMQEIIDWLDKLSRNNEPEYRLMSFTEPNLTFELLNNPTDKEKLIRLKFDLESRPKSATDDKEYYVDILADDEGLKEIIKGLQNELEKYPERKPTA